MSNHVQEYAVRDLPWSLIRHVRYAPEWWVPTPYAATLRNELMTGVHLVRR